VKGQTNGLGKLGNNGAIDPNDHKEARDIMVVCQEEITVGRQRRSKMIGGFRLIESAYAPAMSVPPHFHQQSNITLMLRGGLEERAGHMSEQCGPGSVVFKPAGTVHSNRFGDNGATTFIVELPATSQCGTAVDADRAMAEAPLRQYGWRRDGEAVGAMLRILERWRALEPQRGPVSSDDAEIEEELVYLLSCMGQTPIAVTNVEPPWLQSVREFLHESETMAILVSDVARSVGVHPVYLARVFRRHYGTTMNAYVHRLRVRHAASRLAKSSIPLAELALSLGYADQAHFCRVFKQQMGVTPGRYRRIIRGS